MRINRIQDQPIARTDWFTDARFGMFVHFGLYSIPAGVWRGQRMGRNKYAEWIQMQGDWPHGIPLNEYRLLAKQFNPTRFDAEAMVREAKLAGMKYLVLTTKHHDGFALWPSAVSDYNVVAAASPFGRDIVGEVAAACRHQGLVFCCYYSHWLDWEHPFGGRPHESEFFSEPRWPQPSDDQFEIYWQEKCLPQVRELMDRYQPSLFWFDTWAANSSAQINARRIEQLIALVRGKDDRCLINSRIGTWGHPRGKQLVDVISMMDNKFPKTGMHRPWETSGTMNDSWGFHQLDFNFRSTRSLLGNLIGNVSRGGNYQLNIGPRGDGSLPPASIRRLREIGAWMAVHAEAIHATDACCFDEQTWGHMTLRRNGPTSARLYLHLDGERSESVLRFQLPDGLNPGEAAMLETQQPLISRRADRSIEIKLPDPLAAGDWIPVIAIDCQLTDD